MEQHQHKGPDTKDVAPVVLNSEAENKVLNGQPADAAKKAADAIKGFKEGLKNDSVTEANEEDED